MSDRALRYTLSALLLAGLAISAYLTYTHYADVAPICTIGRSCEKVQQSDYALILGVPVALLGLIGDLAILAAIWVRREIALYAAFGLALVGVGFSVYLTYLELFVIHAICQWCVAHAVVITLVLALVTYWVLRQPEFVAGPHGSAGERI